jgi:hypothetical protein
MPKTKNTKQVRVRNLVDQTGQSGPRSFLYCPECGEHFSANKGDYFQLSPDYVFTHCAVPMWLATEERRIVRQ